MAEITAEDIGLPVDPAIDQERLQREIANASDKPIKPSKVNLGETRSPKEILQAEQQAKANLPQEESKPTSYGAIVSDPNFKSLPPPEQVKVIETMLARDGKFQALPKDEQQKVRARLLPQQAQKAGFNPWMAPVGVLEGLASMAGSTARLAAAGVGGALKMDPIKAGLQGGSTLDQFVKGAESVSRAAESIPFRAETEEGKAVEEVLSLIPKGIEWLGDKVFEATGSPLAGAATQTAANAALLLAGGKGIKKVTEPKRGVENAKGVESRPVLPEAKGKEGEVQRGEDLPVIDRPISEDRQASQEKIAPQAKAIIEPPKTPEGKTIVQKGGKTVQDLSDSLYQLPQQGRAEMINVLKTMKEIPPEDMAVLRSEKMYHSFEDPTIKLTNEEANLKARYLDPMAKESKRIYEKLEANGIEVNDTGYIPRRVVGKGALLDRMATAQGFDPDTGRSLGRKADSTKERTMFAIESPEGERMVVAKASDGTLQGIKDGNGFKIATEGKTTTKDKAGNPVEEVVGASSLKPGDKVSYQGKDWKFADAKTSEIEANTNLRYYKDPFANIVDNLLQLKRSERELDFLNNWKKSPEFRKIATTATGSKVPQGWKTTEMPTFRGYHFEPHVAEVLDDFYRQPGSTVFDMLGKTNKIVVSSMFYNPLPHDFNVLDHWVVQRGARWAYPPAYWDLVQTGVKAIKSVVTQDETYLKMLNEGAGLMYPSVLTEGFYTKLLGNLARDPNMGPVSKAFGYANPMQMVKGIYKDARHGLWAPSDMMMMQAYLEKMKHGEDINKAIAETEKHIPNYRIPSRIVMDNTFGRSLSQLMRNPILSVFGRYHYGVLRSYGEMVKTMVDKQSTLSERGDALGKMAMLGMMGMVVYPALSKIVQEVVGSTNAAFRRYGSAVVPYAIYEMMKGERTPEQVIQGTVTPAPVTKAIVELFTNTNLFNRQQIYNINDSPTKVAGDIAKHAISSSFPFQQGAAILTGKQQPYQILEQQVGIVDPTEKQVENKRRWIERMKRKKKSDEWSADQRQPRSAP